MERALLLHAYDDFRKRGLAPRNWKLRHRNGFELMFILSNGQPKTVNIISDVATKNGGTYLRLEALCEKKTGVSAIVTAG